MILKAGLLTFLTLLFIQSFCEEQPYNLVIHNTDPNARCLDGSSPALYYHEGGDRNKFLVFFVGGGFCSGTTAGQVLQDCYKRSKSDQGTSKVLPPQIISPGGYLSTDPANSRFATWTKVIIMYCDGAQHQGHNDDPIAYKDALLYFRGADNTRSHLKWLQQKYQIQNAEKVLFTGASAGGMATIYWSNYMRSLLKDPTVLSVVADSGIFANASLPNTATYMFDVLAQNLFKIANLDESSPVEGCNLKYPGEEYKCIFVQYNYQFLESKILFINSEYDQVGIQLSLNIKCMKNGLSGKTLKFCNQTEMKFIEGYRQQYLRDMVSLLNNGHSFWTIACCRHSYACYKEMYNVQSQMVPQKVGSTVKDAVEVFVFEGEQVIDIDSESWPNNQPCAF